jgi:hypothetical protein
VEERIETTERLLEVLSKISFENSTLNFKWKFNAQPIVISDTDGDWLAVRECLPKMKRCGWLVWAEFERPDIRTGQIGTGRGRDEIIWRGTTESGVVKTAWVLFHMLIHHEELEGFRYDGVQIFNPHNSVADLSMPARARNSLEQFDTYNLSNK